jgi:hypothetical protein
LGNYLELAALAKPSREKTQTGQWLHKFYVQVVMAVSTRGLDSEQQKMLLDAS